MSLRQDIVIEQNAGWTFTYTHKDASGAPVDLTGWSAAMSIKREFGQTTIPRAYLSSGSDAVGGSIALGGAAGTVTLAMTADQTMRLLRDFDLWALIETGHPDVIVKPRVHLLYDLVLTDAVGNATRAIEGRAIVRRSVTP